MHPCCPRRAREECTVACGRGQGSGNRWTELENPVLSATGTANSESSLMSFLYHQKEKNDSILSWKIWVFPKRLSFIYKAISHYFKCMPFLRACLAVLAGGAANCIPLTEDQSSPLVGKVILFDRAHSFGRDAHGWGREEGDTRLASQISRINPGNQWGDRCRSQISLTSKCMPF